MGCFSENSTRANYPLKCIQKGSSKIWKKLLRKNSDIYCVHRAIRREDNYRESYSKFKQEEYEELQLMKNSVIEEKRNPKITIFQKSTEENEVSTINNKIVGQDLSSGSDNPINLNKNETSHQLVMGSDSETHDLASSSTDYDTNSIDSISVQGERVIVEVQLEKLEPSNDEQEILSESNFESHELLRTRDGKKCGSEIAQKTTDIDGSEEGTLVFPEKNDDEEDDKWSFPEQMNEISSNEIREKDCNSEKSHPSLEMENSVSQKNECDKKHDEKIANTNLVKAEIGIRRLSSKIESTNYELPERREHKTQEANDQFSTPVKIKIKVFGNKRTQLSDFDIDKNEKYNEEIKESNCIGLQKSNTEDRRQKVLHLVNLYEKQAFPSPISKITSAKIPPVHTSIQKIEGKNNEVGRAEPTECEITTVSSLRNPKRRNLSEEYDLIEYSSVRLESLMTQADGFNSGYQRKWISNDQTPVRMKTPRKDKSPYRLSIEEDSFSFLRGQNTAISELTHNIENDATLIERKKKYQAMLAWMWTWMF